MSGVRSTPGQGTAGPKRGVLPGRARQLDLPPAGYRGWAIQGRSPGLESDKVGALPSSGTSCCVALGTSLNLSEAPGGSSHEERMQYCAAHASKGASLVMKAMNPLWLCPLPVIRGGTEQLPRSGCKLQQGTVVPATEHVTLGPSALSPRAAPRG